jgi:hypothetical protein
MALVPGKRGSCQLQGRGIAVIAAHETTARGLLTSPTKEDQCQTAHGSVLE